MRCRHYFCWVLCQTLVVTLRNVPDGNLTLTIVKKSILNEEIRRNEHGTNANSDALVTVIKKRKRSKTRHSQSLDKRDN